MARVEERAAARFALHLGLVCEVQQPNEKVSEFGLGGASPVENGVVAAEPSRGASLCLAKQPSTQEKFLAKESQDAMNRAGDGAVVLDEPPRHGA
jgi:hypothetical protein